MFTLLQALQFKSKFCKEFCKNNYKKELKTLNNENIKTPEVENPYNPSHYKLDGLDVESIDVVKSVLGQDGFRDFCLGNILKYAIRCKKKGMYYKDIQKTKRYCEFIIKSYYKPSRSKRDDETILNVEKEGQDDN